MTRPQSQPSIKLIYASAALGLAAIGIWIIGATSEWSFSIIRHRGDFRLRFWSDESAFHIGETHHFEQWDVAYWKLLLLALVPAVWHLQLSVRQNKQARLAPADKRWRGVQSPVR